MNDACDRCGDRVPGIGSFAQAFRAYAARLGAPPPGNLCGACAAIFASSLLIAEAEAYGRCSADYLDQQHNPGRGRCA